MNELLEKAKNCATQLENNYDDVRYTNIAVKEDILWAVKIIREFLSYNKEE